MTATERPAVFIHEGEHYRKAKRYVRFVAEKVLRETDKAFCFKTADGDKWVPKSVCRVEPTGDDELQVSYPNWVKLS